MTAVRVSPLQHRVASPRFALGALAGWTVFVWISRIRNVVADDALEGFAKAWRLGVAVGFVAAAAAVAALLVTTRSRAGTPTGGGSALVGPVLAAVGSALAVVGILWWPIRTVMTLLDDFSGAFKVVHVLLAVVTVALSGNVLRALRR